MAENNCNHNHLYFFDNKARCLHELFERGLVAAMTRQVTRDTVEFHLWREKLVKNKKGRYAGKYRLFGTRSKLDNREQIIFAIDLAEKYNVQRVRL